MFLSPAEAKQITDRLLSASKDESCVVSIRGGDRTNLRFNESPVAMLSNIVAMGPSERTHGGEVENVAFAAPPLLVKDFTFSSRSSGI